MPLALFGGKKVAHASHFDKELQVCPMETKNTAESDAKTWQGSRVERLFNNIDALNEEVNNGLDDVHDEALDAVSSRLGCVQGSLHREQELRKRIPGETMSRLKQNELPERVRLNVGGKLFATSLATLTSIKDTFFDSMFGGECLLVCSCCFCCRPFARLLTVLAVFVSRLSFQVAGLSLPSQMVPSPWAATRRVSPWYCSSFVATQ